MIKQCFENYISYKIWYLCLFLKKLEDPAMLNHCAHVAKMSWNRLVTWSGHASSCTAYPSVRQGDNHSLLLHLGL